MTEASGSPLGRDTLEREVKMTAPPELRLPSLSDPDTGVVAGATSDIELVATYYDSEDFRLARAGVSLRYRTNEGWVVKLPESDVASRDESGAIVRTEHSFPGGPSVPPEGALDLVQALVRSARILPVARLHTMRHCVTLLGADGSPLGQLVDDDVTVLEGERVVRRFRELEFELAASAPSSAAGPIVDRLRGAGAGAPDPTPKVVRALGPRAAGPPDVMPATGRTASTIAEVVQSAITASVARLLENDPGVRLGVDPEAVHQARVATRRLRSHLRTFRSLLEPEWTTTLRDELRWLGAELGAVRDAEVLLERLHARIENLDHLDDRAAAELLAGLTEQRAAARAELLTGLRAPRYVQLLDQLVDAAHRPRLVLRLAQEGETDADVLRGLVRVPWRHLRAAVQALPDDPPDPALHEIRIRAKRARYASEAVEPAFGAPARRFASAMTALQDVLGEHQDAVVAGEWLRETAASSGDVAVAFVAGALATVEREAAAVARDAWVDEWHAASRKRLRAWL